MGRHICTNINCNWENVITTTVAEQEIPGVGIVEAGTEIVTVVDNSKCYDTRRNHFPAHRFTQVLKKAQDPDKA